MRAHPPPASIPAASLRSVLLAAILVHGAALSAPIEVLHAWSGESDAKALAVLRGAVSAQGHSWRDFNVVGGGGNGMTSALLQFRVRAGNPPSVAQVSRPTIALLARQGQLASLDAVARAQDWDAVLPAPVRTAVQHDGHYVAVPVNVHRLNWLWINADALQRAGASVPSTWQQFFDTADKLKRAGYVAVAHGGEQWQDHLLFQTVALGVGGGAFYRSALLDHDPAALSSPTMEQVLLTFRRIKQYTQPKAPARRWMKASDWLIKGTAAMQFMGDWAKPTFLQAQARSGFAFHCTPAPGSEQYFLFASDAFAVFKPSDAAAAQAQLDFASMAMSAPVQAAFNQAKGSTPVRLDADLSGFDRCGRIAGQAYRRAVHNGSLIPNVAMPTGPDIESAIPAITSAFWRDNRMTPAMTMKRLVQAARPPR